MADRIDHAGNASEAVETPIRKIGDVSHASEREQMMRAHSMYGNVADQHHIPTRILETGAECLSRIGIVAVQQTLLPQLAHALSGLARMR